jgi:hypothetical protein
MLIPKEKPYLTGLNSYYLHFEKFIEHLQGEIGSGCLYCEAADQEILVYFDEREIIRGVTQGDGKHARVSQDLDAVLHVLTTSNFLITVYYLDSASVFYWGEMPPFKRNKNNVTSNHISLANLVKRLKDMTFSGFVDVDIENHRDRALLFFHKGECCGASCSWGTGGLSLSENDFNRVLTSTEEADSSIFSIGQFVLDKPVSQETGQKGSTSDPEEGEYLSDLGTAIKEFLNIYIKILGKKIKTDPIIALKQMFLDSIDEYPLLDPFANFFQLNNRGEVVFSANVNKKEIAAGIVNCTWKVIVDYKLEKKFRSAVYNWDYKVALEERGITVLF